MKIYFLEGENMCVDLNRDIIVASEVSDFIDFLNDFIEKERVEILKEHRFNVERCLDKQKSSRFYGMGNVFAVSTKEDYVRFVSKSKALIYKGNGEFMVNPINITCDALGVLNKEDIIKDIFTCAYSSDTLKTMAII